MKFKASTNKKLSVALGILSFFAALVLIQGDVWGFPELAKQVFAAVTGFVSLFNMYFLGSTAEKLKGGK